MCAVLLPPGVNPIAANNNNNNNNNNTFQGDLTELGHKVKLLFSYL
jgi:hypothetical protein